MPVPTMITSASGVSSGSSIIFPLGPVSVTSCPTSARHRKLEQTPCFVRFWHENGDEDHKAADIKISVPCILYFANVVQFGYYVIIISGQIHPQRDHYLHFPAPPFCHYHHYYYVRGHATYSSAAKTTFFLGNPEWVGFSAIV